MPAGRVLGEALPRCTAFSPSIQCCANEGTIRLGQLVFKKEGDKRKHRITISRCEEMGAIQIYKFWASTRGPTLPRAKVTLRAKTRYSAHAHLLW